MSQPHEPNDLPEALKIMAPRRATFAESRRVMAPQRATYEQQATCIKALEQQVRALKQQVEALEQQVEAVGRKLEEAVRAGKRQAGPFSKGPPKVNPQKPGQKEGHTAVHRAVPTKIDQTLKALLPAHCECGGVIVADEVQQQWPLRGPLYQVDIPRPKVALRGAIPTKVTQWPSP